MACLRCGSDWVTVSGKDKVSCPECCKQQRFKARRRGLIPSRQEKTCERCGSVFTANGANAMANSRHCEACGESARLEYLRERRRKVKAGDWLVNPQTKNQPRKCLRCGTSLKNGQKKYCGRECYNAAKKEGIQSWDRTRQEESIWHRGGRWSCAPSRKPIAEMRGNMHAFLRKVRRLASRAMIRLKPCKQCGSGTNQRFCSEDCRLVWEDGRKERRRAAKKKYDKVAGKHFKQRARRFGVGYVRFGKSMIYERDGYTCQLCRNPVLQTATYNANDGKINMRSPTIDHIVPLSRGGNHEPSNCQTACFECNSKKGNRQNGELCLATG